MNKLNQNGLVLVTVLVVMSVFTMVAISMMTTASSRYAASTNSTFVANSLLVAEAGIERSLQQLNSNDNFAGFTSVQQFFNSQDQGRGEYTTTVTNTASDPNAKVITSTGRVYRFGKNTPVSTRIVKVTAVGTTSVGDSVQTGPGGLILGGAAGILNANISVNGTLTMTGSSHIGTGLLPVNVNVANYACPTGSNPGASYPALCNTPDPISLGWATYIYGTVCATGQTSRGPSGMNIQGGLLGLGGEGLKPGCVAPPAPIAIYDKPAQVSAVTTTAASNNSNYNCGLLGLGSTWTDKLRLNGNVNIGGVCTIVLRGDVYITGNLNIDGASRFLVDNSVGSNRPRILVDGKITVGGAAMMLTNLSGTGAEFISYRSSASCNPNCTNLSGTELKTSSALETISIGGSAIVPGMVFNAQWGKLTIGGVGSVGAAAGQTIDMQGSGNVTFGISLSSGVKSWTISSYQQKYPGQP